MELFIYIFLILLNDIFTSNNKIYKIPFGLFKQHDWFQPKITNIVNNIITNGKYLNLSIGTPSQITPFELDSNSQTFSASSELFNRNLSSSYKQVSEKEININFEVAEKGYNSKDILKLGNNVNKEVHFILGTRFQTQKKNNLGVIGLHIPNLVQNYIYPFFESLKSAELISSFIWTLKFFDNVSLIDQITYNEGKDNIIGEFIFGDEPSKYEDDKSKYNDSEFYKISPLTTKGDINWDLEFSNIYINFREKQNNSKINYLGEKKAEIVINFSYMLAPNYFFDFIRVNYFEQYLNKFVCLEKISDYTYNYIECDFNSSFTVSSFPDICFEHAGFETTFVLTYKDLFILDKATNKYIFLIMTTPYYADWLLGSVFLRKFQFVFNHDSKTIGYYRYTPESHEGNNKENLLDANKSKIIKTVFIFILVIIFSFLLIFFGMIIQRKYFNKNRKMRANELEENFSYEGKNTDENKLEVNDDKKIIKDDNGKEVYYSI